MEIPIDKLQYKFFKKPLVIGGKAMEYYGLRKAGLDIDFVISNIDHDNLKAKYPDHVKNLYGDIGICEFGFEIWNTICRYDYDFLIVDGIEEEQYFVVSIGKLLFLKAIGIRVQKYYNDIVLLADRIMAIQHEKK